MGNDAGDDHGVARSANCHRKRAADVRGTVVVLLNGKPAEKLELTPENNDLLHQFVFKDIEQHSAERLAPVRGKGSACLSDRGELLLALG